MQNQKEILEDGSKELSSSLIAGHSRKAIVDINTRATRLLSGGRNNYFIIAVASAVVKQVEGILLIVKLPTSDDRHHHQVFVTEHDRTKNLHEIV